MRQDVGSGLPSHKRGWLHHSLEKRSCPICCGDAVSALNALPRYQLARVMELFCATLTVILTPNQPQAIPGYELVFLNIVHGSALLPKKQYNFHFETLLYCVMTNS